MLELAKTLQTFHQGVHAFVYVLNGYNPRFTEEEQNTLYRIVVSIITIITNSLRVYSHRA